MDHSIAIITPEMHRARGADAFDQGLGIDAHGMNPGSAAIADWRQGYIERRAERRAEHAQSCVDQLLAMAIAQGCPP